MTRAYWQDVKTMSDEELKTLSDEMDREYRSADYDGLDCWSDVEAESRYYEMRAEQRRRFNLENPDYRDPLQPLMSMMAKTVLMHMRNTSMFSQNLFKSDPPTKIGNTITVRKPYRFTTLRETTNV